MHIITHNLPIREIIFIVCNLLRVDGKSLDFTGPELCNLYSVRVCLSGCKCRYTISRTVNVAAFERPNSTECMSYRRSINMTPFAQVILTPVHLNPKSV